MFDMFGMSEERGLKGSVEAMAKGVTLGLLDGYEWRLTERDNQIKGLNEKVMKLEAEIEELKSKKK